MSAPATFAVRLTGDARPAVSALGALTARLEKLPERSIEILHGLIHLPEFPEKLVRINVDGGATGAGDRLVAFNPSDGLRVLSAAALAGNIDGVTIENAFGHEIRSLAESRQPVSVAERRAAEQAVRREGSR
jgi:hypothetical protein